MSWRVGVDTGGTFTDVCIYDEEARELIVGKVSSTPRDPGAAVRTGVADVLTGRAGAALSDVSYFAHGSTVATNALLQERGVATALITTRGFRDLLELERQRRPRLYDLRARKSTPLVSRDLRLEVNERVDHRGEVLTALDDSEVRRHAATIRDSGVTAVSICLLYSFLNPAHEIRIRNILHEELDGVFISVSHEVLPEFREFERLSTVVINSYIGPVMAGYLRLLRTGLIDDGLVVDAKMTQSNGGIMSFETAQQYPVRTVLSGPSTGVVGAARVSAASGIEDIITFDMGGTSSDVALVRGARPTQANGMELEGRPVKSPMLDINTVGAGGGSIAWVDDGGHLRVGPQSAGADPGPACYGKGTTQPTVTDANVVLGILNQTHLLAGSMPIDASLSFQAVEALADQLGLPVLEAAQGIISVVTANMVRAIRVVSVQKGYDPADYALVSFGGAGPLHSGRLAAELGMRHTIIPQRPGALSALGMLMTDLRADFTRSTVSAFDAKQLPAIQSRLGELRARADEWFVSEAIAESNRTLEPVLELRYAGQNYELRIEVPADVASPGWLEEVLRRFHDAHRVRYGYANPDAAIEVATYRVGAIGAVPAASFPAEPLQGSDASAAIVGSRDIYLPEYGERRSCPLYDRDLLQPGNIVEGPAVIEQYDTTSFILPGETARVDQYRLILTEQ
ncbi:hydantoinase/oxoprolinase family protein [Streptomyces chartreusis]|uniref:hydantoinase/oxoprolinase family protein n=1 Tax=Streptomyces chartreusis TaxID=1969 RepID=UPI0033F805F0